MFAVFVVLQIIALVSALLRSLRCRFVLGVLGGVARTALLVAGVASALTSRAVTSSGSSAAGPISHAWPTLTAFASVVLGPVVSFGVLYVAWRRARNVPAAEEERASRPFSAWLPAALFDAAYVVINVLGYLIASNA